MDTFVYVPHTRSSNIADTLNNINSAFASLDSLQKLGSQAVLDDLPRLFGFSVTASTFPNINVSAGKLILRDGTVYNFAGGIMATAGAAGTTYYVYVTDAYALAVNTTVPGTALLTLATVVINGGGTDFASFDQGTTNESYTYNGNNEILSIELRSGPLVLKTWDYTYLGDGRVDTITETSENFSIVREYIYDLAGNRSQVIETPTPFKFRA